MGWGQLRRSAWLSVPALCLQAVVSTPAWAEPSETDTEQTAPLATPVIIAPRVLFTPPVIYPSGETARGREVVRLVVEPDGTVSEVELVESLGPAFDEVAQRVAREMVFTPAAKDGVFLRTRVLYKFDFAPEATPASTQETSAEQASTVGDISGVVRVAGADVPLAGATVLVEQQGQPPRQLVTGEDGSFRAANLRPGSYKISITADGFADVQSEEVVVAGQDTAVVYRTPGDSDGVEVTVSGERPPREVTRRTITRREMQKVPGTGGDALRSIQSLPGVARPPGLAGLLIVRGSAPQDTLTFIDGANVPLIYHFGGLSSVVPTELLDRIDFYPGNYSVKYGRAMGGIVDVALRKPNTECVADYGKPLEGAEQTNNCFHGALEVDLINARAIVQGPIGKDWTFAAAGRRSYADAWAGPLLRATGADVTSAPVYYDWQLMANTEPTRSSDLSLRFYGSDDRFEIITRDASAREPGIAGGSILFHTAFMRLQGVYENQLTRDVELRTMLSLGRDSIEFRIAQAEFNLDTLPVGWRSEIGFALFSGTELNLGLDFLGAPYDLNLRLPEPPRPGEVASGPFTLRPLLSEEDQGISFRPAWYAEAVMKPSRRLSVVPGVRLDFARDSGQVDVAPRVSARYDLIGGDAESELEGAEKQRRTTLKAGAGIFYQPPQFQETNDVFGTPNLDSNRAVHYSLGVEQELTERVSVSLEGYYKDLSSLVSRAPTASGQFAYGNQGSGHIVGLETLLRYEPDERFFGWLAYTLSQSIRKNSPSEEEYLSEYDQTHNLTVLGSYRLGDGWEVGARFRLVSGNLATPEASPPSVPSVYAADAATYSVIAGKPTSLRLPTFHQLDVRIEKSWQFQLWRLTAYLDIWNSYNNPARESLNYNFDYSRRSYALGLPLIPSFGFRGEF